MNKGVLETLVPETKAQFIEAFPQSADLIQNTEIYVILNSNREKKRLEVFERCAARVKEDGPNEGEAVIGANGRAVIIYATVIKSQARFKKVLWHELGHIYSQALSRELFEEAEKDMLLDNDTLIRNGMCIWSEFIAEVISYIVEDTMPRASAWQSVAIMENLMDEAVNSGNLSPYPLAFFNAMLYEDPTVVAWREQNDYVVPGLNNCDDDILPLLKNISDVLGEQLQKEDFVSITRETLESIGNCVNELWDFCEMAVFSRTMQKWKKGLSDLL